MKLPTILLQVVSFILLLTFANGQSTIQIPTIQPSPSSVTQPTPTSVIIEKPSTSIKTTTPSPVVADSSTQPTPTVVPEKPTVSTISKASTAIKSSPSVTQPTVSSAPPADTTSTTTTIPTTTTTSTTTKTVPTVPVITKAPTAKPSLSSFTYKITNDTEFCNGNGNVLQSIEREDMKFCSCMEDYYGLKCESKVDKLLSKIVFGLGILAGILLILALFMGCQWHSRLGDIEDKNIEVKELSVEKDILKKQNIDLKRRSPSPAGRPRSNYAPSNYAQSNYAPSVMGSPNGGFYEDDRRSMYNEPMPTYDPSQKRLSAAQLPNGDLALRMEDDGDNTDDELDAIARSTVAKQNKPAHDTISIASASTTNSEMVLIPRNQQHRGRQRPMSQEIISTDAVLVDSRGYIVRSRSPSPRSHELSFENLKAFDHGDGSSALQEQRGRARSLMDLRIAALNGEAQRQNPGSEFGSNLGPKSRSIENLLTGQVHRLAPRPKSPNGSVASGGSGRPHGRGIYAQQRRREMEDSAF